MEFLKRIKEIAEVIVDSYFVVDAERNIVDFNRPFHAMLPRGVARGLRGRKCYDVLQLDICRENCIAHRCWRGKGHLRMDEIHGRVAKTDKDLTFILSALPFFDDKGAPQAALVVHRNVTDEAQVQIKYQEMLDNAGREREQLQHILRERTRDLIETSQRLVKVQKELLGFKSGRVV